MRTLVFALSLLAALSAAAKSVTLTYVDTTNDVARIWDRGPVPTDEASARQLAEAYMQDQYVKYPSDSTVGTLSYRGAFQGMTGFTWTSTRLVKKSLNDGIVLAGWSIHYDVTVRNNGLSATRDTAIGVAIGLPQIAYVAYENNDGEAVDMSAFERYVGDPTIIDIVDSQLTHGRDSSWLNLAATVADPRYQDLVRLAKQGGASDGVCFGDLPDASATARIQAVIRRTSDKVKALFRGRGAGGSN